MYTKQFEIRWSDVDANRHLRNSAYIDYMSHIRMSYFQGKGLNQSKLEELNLGIVALYEHMFYFKEAFIGKPLKVSLQLRGVSEEGTFFSFEHNFYDSNGKNTARCEMLGAFIDLKTRKLIPAPQFVWDLLEHIEKTSNFKTITKEDTRKYGQFPKDIQ